MAAGHSAESVVAVSGAPGPVPLPWPGSPESLVWASFEEHRRGPWGGVLLYLVVEGEAENEGKRGPWNRVHREVRCESRKQIESKK